MVYYKKTWFLEEILRVKLIFNKLESPFANLSYKYQGPLYKHTRYHSSEMYERFVLVLTFSVCTYATQVPSIPPWSSAQYIEQSGMKNFLQSQKYPQYTWLPIKLLKTSLAIYGIEKLSSRLQKCLELRRTYSNVCLDRSAEYEINSQKIELIEEKIRSAENWGVPSLGWSFI